MKALYCFCLYVKTFLSFIYFKDHVPPINANSPMKVAKQTPNISVDSGIMRNWLNITVFRTDSLMTLMPKGKLKICKLAFGNRIHRRTKRIDSVLLSLFIYSHHENMPI